MKKLFTLIALAISTSAFADGYSLYYDLSSGAKNTEVSSVSNLQKIIFDHNGNMIICKKDGSSETIDITSVSRIFFATPTAVDIKKVDSEKKDDVKNIYDLTGRKVDASKTLTPGIYIINGQKTIIK